MPIEMTYEEAMEVVMRQKTKGMLGREGVVQFIQAARVLAKRCEQMVAGTRKIIQSCHDSCMGDENEGDFGERIEAISMIARNTIAAITQEPTHAD